MSVQSSELPRSPSGTTDGTRQAELALERGATLLTPTVRSARWWSRRVDAARRAAGLLTWSAAEVLPWRAWTASLWTEAFVNGADDRVLLNEVQELALWRRVIEEDATPTLKSTAAQARLCAGALRLLGQYDVEHRFAEGRYGEGDSASDATTFARWFLRFEQVCLRERLLPAAYLEAELASAFSAKRLAPGGEYVLWGFAELTPAQRALTHAAEQAGARVVWLHAPLRPGRSLRMVRCADAHAESDECARWLRDRLANGATELAVVVPDLQTTRAELERELRAVVAPSAADVTRRTVAPYEFSTGRPISRLALVADAIRLLQWCAAPVSVEDAGAVLCSPSLKLAPTPERGGELHAGILRKDRPLRAELSLTGAIASVEQQDHFTAARLASLRAAAERLATSVKTFAGCADAARGLLEVASWPAQELNSEEHQAVERWNELLDTLSTLDLLGERVSYPEFVRQLAALAADTLFAPENRGAPVQVMTVEEAVGACPAALWFLRAGEQGWPPAPSPHALLPFSLQRALGMPGTSATRDEERARELLTGLLHGAEEAVFSYTAQVEDSPQQPSSAVERLITEEAGTWVDATQTLPPESAPALLEVHTDRSVLPPPPAGVLAGGVGVITAQAQCGFRAFAERRLFASEPEAIEPGLSQADRGNQIHRILQAFWTVVQDHGTLLRMRAEPADRGESASDALLRRLIEHEIGPPLADSWSAAYLEVQSERLFRLLSRWFDTEAERVPFSVLLLEKEVPDVRVGPLHLSLRVDRVDRIGTPPPTGEEDARPVLLIDYKTGKATYNDWLGARPNLPQLPVYAVEGAEAAGLPQVGGIAFGLVRVQKDGMCLNGLSDPGILPARKRDFEFEQQLTVWHEEVERLAEAFAGGDAALDPKEFPKTCDTCPQRLLCRIDGERRLQVDDPDESDEVFGWG